MSVEASLKSAAIIGALSGTSIALTDLWIKYHQPLSGQNVTTIWLVAIVAFIFVPGYFFVLGHGNELPSRTWFLLREDRDRHWVTVKRISVGWVFAVIFGASWHAGLIFLLGEIPKP